MAKLLHQFQLDLFALGAKLVKREGQRFLAIPIDSQMFINEKHAFVDFTVFECETEYSSAYIVRKAPKGGERQPICGNIRKYTPILPKEEDWSE